MTITCPGCKESLPPLSASDDHPRRGDWLECGLCGRVWRFRMGEEASADKAEESTQWH